MSHSELSPTVYGIETEYTCLVYPHGQEPLELVGACHSEDVELGLFKPPQNTGSANLTDTFIVSALREVGIVATPQKGMLSNGGRLYKDPSGFEYATPETRTAEEAVHRSYDGDEILLSVLTRAREKGVIRGFQLNRHAVDHIRSSRGVHLNTSTMLNPSTVSDPNFAYAHATLNTAKGAMFGSGGLLVNLRGETEFHHSPRLSITNNLVSHNWSDRPLFRKPKPEKRGGIYRVESVTSDALNFSWPLRASLVMTNALNKLLEMKYSRDLHELLYQPVNSAQLVGKMGPDAIVEIIRDGKYISIRPQEILSHLAEVALRADETRGHLDDESKQVLHEVIDTADALNLDPSLVATRVESVARYAALQKKMEATRTDIESERICRFDYAWDWIGGEGVAETLRKKNKAGWHGFSRNYSPGAVRKRLITPPQDTRAKTRGDRIKEMSGAVKIYEWDEFDTGTGVQYVHPLAA